MTRTSHYLFVYGTLRRHSLDLSQHPLLSDCRFVSNATMAGQLYEVNGYPGAVAVESGLVHGELYWMPNPELILPALDNYEECAAQFPAPHEYLRCQQTITLNKQSTLGAWVYLYNWSVANLRRIPSGDYFSEAQIGRQ